MTTTIARIDTVTAEKVRSAARHRRLISRILTYFSLGLFGVLFAFPLFWVVSSSLQTWQELRSYTPHLFPAIPQWHNYAQVFEIVPFGRWMLNSFIVIGIIIPGTLITATMCAYAFARFDFAGRDTWFIIMLSTMMIPGWVTMIPQYILFFKIKLIDTYVPLTIGAWLGGGAFTIFMLRQFLMSIPKDLDEAAHIDGAGPFRILWQVLVPLMKPALTTVGILSFLGAWNNWFGPFIYLNKTKLFTAALGIRYFQQLPTESTDPKDHLLNAAAAIMTIPVLALFVVAQQYFVSGIVLSGIKM